MSEQEDQQLLRQVEEIRGKLNSGVLLTPAEYSAFLKLLAQAEIQSQTQRMRLNQR